MGRMYKKDNIEINVISLVFEQILLPQRYTNQLLITILNNCTVIVVQK
jgi:hypothetical protein